MFTVVPLRSQNTTCFNLGDYRRLACSILVLVFFRYSCKIFHHNRGRLWWQGLSLLRGKRAIMAARVSTVAFQGIEGVPVDVQVMVAPGKVGMQIVGLPDKAVAESRERIQAALHASGLSLPAKKVTVNLAPADLPKEGDPLPHSQLYPFT